MPRTALENNSRLSLRIPAADKALLLRAAALQNTNLTDFVIRTAVQAAREVIAQAERGQSSKQDSLRVLDLLENPPAPNDQLLAAARALEGRTTTTVPI